MKCSIKFAFALLIAAVCTTMVNAQISIDSVNVILGQPNTLYVSGRMPDLSIERIEIASLNDSYNTQVVTIYFDSCPVNQLLVSYDTLINLTALFPFRIYLYTVHDTTVNCPYPVQPIITDSLFLTSEQIMSISERENLEKKIKIYPNPAKGLINLEVDNDLTVTKIRLFDTQGKEILNYKNLEKKIKINGLSKGQYFLLIECNKGHFQQKIMIE